MKFVLIVVDEKEKTQYFGPFDDGEKAFANLLQKVQKK